MIHFFIFTTTFSKLIIATPGQTATDSATLNTNATVGTSILPSGLTEVKVLNTQITPLSLVYLTPTSPTQNQVLYLKTKKAGESFTVAIEQPISQDIQLQWWIIN